MAIGDCIESAAPWPPARVKQADAALRAEGIVTLSELRQRYWRRFAAVVERGRIVSQPEYYLVKGIASDASAPSEPALVLETLLAEYEARLMP